MRYITCIAASSVAKESVRSPQSGHTKDTGNKDKISGLARADVYCVCMHNYTLCSGCFTTIIVCITVVFMYCIGSYILVYDCT